MHKELDDTATTTSNFVIPPFVAAIPYPYPLKINSAEVERIIEVPIAALLDRRNFREETHLHHGEAFPEYFYNYNGQVIWGATANILKHFLDLVSPILNEKNAKL